MVATEDFEKLISKKSMAVLSLSFRPQLYDISVYSDFFKTSKLVDLKQILQTFLNRPLLFSLLYLLWLTGCQILKYLTFFFFFFCYRYSCTVVSNVLVYVITWVSLKLGENTDPSDQIGPNDAVNFQRVVYVGLALGAVASLIFHLGVKEPNSERNVHSQKRSHKSVFQFLKDAKLYQVNIISAAI